MTTRPMPSAATASTIASAMASVESSAAALTASSPIVVQAALDGALHASSAADRDEVTRLWPGREIGFQHLFVALVHDLDADLDRHVRPPRAVRAFFGEHPQADVDPGQPWDQARDVTLDVGV